MRDEQAKIFRSIPPIDPQNVVRGQFAGYRSEPGVAPDSQIETFAAMRLEVDSWRWAGVPFLIRTGKCLPVTATEVLVKLKEPPLRRVQDGCNYLRFRVGPDLSLTLGARIKRPGPKMESMPTELSAVKMDLKGELDAYERLLTDAMRGEQLLFVRQDAVEAAWAIVDSILSPQATPLHEYAKGSWGPPETDALAAGIGGWHDPSSNMSKAICLPE
jgi:glucose-6-phosphate 1-dehydrogenase